MKLPVPARVLLCTLMLALGACSNGKKDSTLAPPHPFKDRQQTQREQRAQAGELYKAARASLDVSDFQTAISRYDQLILRFPFTDYATQAELERIYAQHRSYNEDQALSNADKFLREHPRHPAVDYVQYLKGVINMAREDSFSGMLGLDTTKEDVGYSRRAFDDFALLIQKHPDSRFNADARQRMIYLRNRLAAHDLHVVHFYMERRAFVAAAKRAEQLVQQYAGAPAVLEALGLMERAYRELGLNQQAEDAGKLYAAQLAVTPPAEQPRPGFWKSLFGNS
jgi:outer membrane protein assembly factor BamD